MKRSSPRQSLEMLSSLLAKRSLVTRTVTVVGRISCVALVTIVGACQRSTPLRECIPYSPDLTQTFTGGLIRQDFRIANAWAVKSDKPMDAVNASVPAYFLSADIVAPNGEAVIGTWLTDDIAKAGRIYSVSPQAVKYTNWGGVGDRLTAGISMETGGAKQSIDCVLSHRGKAAQAGGSTP
jgi:hypothetical protein